MAMISLSACGGCQASLLSNKDELIAIARQVEIAFCPMLMDAEEIGEVDIALVDGAVRAKEDVEKLEEARTQSRFLVAWGTCAAFGGIPALANAYELEELIEGSYGETVDPLAYHFAGAALPLNHTYQEGSTGLLRKAGKLDDFVRVDYYLPGCPPESSLLARLVQEFKGEEQGREPRQIVCSECPRKPRKGPVETVRLFPEQGCDPGDCFLSAGALCMGFSTRGGCSAPCTRGGFPCWGCRGPSESSIKKIGEGAYFEELMLSALSRRLKLAEESLKPVVRLFRRQGGSALSFEQNFVQDTSRLR